MLTKIIFLASFLLLAVATVLFYLNLGSVSNFITIGIDTDRGINLLGRVSDVWGALGTAAAINFINIFLAAVFWHRNRFLAQLLSFVSLLASLLILIAIGVIITNN